MDPHDVDLSELRSAVTNKRPDAVDVARAVGARAAELATPLREVFTELERCHAEGETPYQVARELAVAYSEALTAHHLSSQCEDPLTGWSTPQHLRSVLAGHYRRAELDEADLRELRALAVIELPPVSQHPIEQALRAIDLGQVVEQAFGGDSVFVRFTSRRFAVMARTEDLDATAIRLLTTLLRNQLGKPEPRLWVELLPSRMEDLSWTLSGLLG